MNAQDASLCFLGLELLKIVSVYAEMTVISVDVSGITITLWTELVLPMHLLFSF